MIKFSIPYIPETASLKMEEVLKSGHIQGNGKYTKACEKFFEKRYGAIKAIMTPSCTDALEMCAILLDIQPGDEVIVPDYTFVSTVNPFILQGGRPVFVDSSDEHPNICLDGVKKAISPRTKAIVVVHYGGVAIDMDRLLEIADGIPIVEDAAHSIDAHYKGRQLGTIGTFGTFSFHDTKNISCGEGGMLLVNKEGHIKRAEIIRDKGTNRSSFFRGEVNKYGWMDIGSSFLPSELQMALLDSQLECIDKIQANRLAVWENYQKYLNLAALKKVGITTNSHPEYASHNAHLYYILCKSVEQRDRLLKRFENKNIQAAFHYQALHKSKFGKSFCTDVNLTNSLKFSNQLVRLPLHEALTEADVEYIANILNAFADG